MLSPARTRRAHPQFARALTVPLEGDDDRWRRWLAAFTLVGAILAAVAGSATTEAALVPMAPLLISFPMAAHGLGAHRDWDLALVPGLLATTFAGAALVRLDAPRLRGALAMLLPALLLLAGAWLAPNASETATLQRAVTLVHGTGGVTGEARGHALVYLGYRASDAGEDAASARWFDEAFGASANPRTALLAAESWLRAGDFSAARQSVDRARSIGKLPADLEKVARELEQVLAIEGGSAGNSPGSHP